MNIKSKKERVKVGAHKGKDMFIMKMDYYNTVDTEKIIQYAHDVSCIPAPMLRASWEAISLVINSWVVDGHIVKIPGLGNIRASIRAKARTNAEDISTTDILYRKIMLTPTKAIKQALNTAPVRIVCIDKNGHEIRRIEETDDDE